MKQPKQVVKQLSCCIFIHELKLEKGKVVKLSQKNVVKKFSIGNTHIKICNDYCINNPKKVKEILSNIAKRSLPHIRSEK